MVKQSVAYQALQKIVGFYNADTELKELQLEQSIQKRQKKFCRWLRNSLRQ